MVNRNAEKNNVIMKIRDQRDPGEANLEVNAERSRTRGRWDLLYFSVFSALGALVILYPSAFVRVLAAAVSLGLLWWAIVRLRRAGLKMWQGILLFTLTGYMLLSYGFENIAFHVGGFPIIISYALMYASLALAVYSSRQVIVRALAEPAMLCVIGLLLFSTLHLVRDIPSYGLWAVRDSTMILDGLFFFLGLLWAMKKNSVTVLTKWLMVVIVLNMIYCFTFPWRERIMAASPTSGVFLEVPILGQYHTTDIYLLQGAIFCLGVGGYLFKRRRWILIVLVMVQLLGLTIIQARASYVALAAFIVILTLLGETRKSKILVGMLASALVLLVVATSVGGLEITGRIGPVSISFLRDHLRTITGARVTEASTVESRFDWVHEGLEHFRSSPVFGVGFGQALVDYVDDETGAAVRYPHNSNLTILVRLGVTGFAIWALFNFCMLKRFFYAFQQRKNCDREVYELILWSFTYYVTFMISALVEAPFEFPSSAVPFYFFMGLGIGLIRWQLPQEKKSKAAVAAFVPSLGRVNARPLGSVR
jgi:O-antigen ligase